jgi:hypothetical protein
VGGRENKYKTGTAAAIVVEAKCWVLMEDDFILSDSNFENQIRA